MPLDALRLKQIALLPNQQQLMELFFSFSFHGVLLSFFRLTKQKSGSIIETKLEYAIFEE